MKKVLVTLIALSLPAFALADETKGFYVQADAGHATVKLGGASIKGFSPRISAGYDFGDFRVAADYTHYKSAKINVPRYMLRLNITVPVYLLFMILTCKLL